MAFDGGENSYMVEEGRAWESVYSMRQLKFAHCNCFV